MMGRQTADQAQLFYSFNLEERIPASHLLRRIDIFVTQVLADLSDENAHIYDDAGRMSQPSTAVAIRRAAASSRA